MTASRGEYISLFLIALATLMLEILLTRIFSVTLWYHLAFVAVSIAMFGMTAGAVLVYACSSWFTPARTRGNLAASVALFGVSAAWTVDAHLRLALDPALITSPLTQLMLAYGLIAVPFVFSGIAVSILLTQFPRQTSSLYAADLAGAAVGCVALSVVVDRVGGPRAVFVVTGAAALATLILLFQSVDSRRTVRFAGVLSLVVLAYFATFRTALDRSILDLGFYKGNRGNTIYEKWNSYSRIAVAYPRQELPFGWGLSDRYQPTDQLSQLRLNIDASAETVLTEFDGNLGPLEHLKYDVTNIGHYLVDDGNIFVVGAGGGRDVLSALVFNQKRVVAAEMNSAILDAVNVRFGEFTGHLDRHPKVRFVNDEARNYLARSTERFDLIQLSLIDTWAATAAGAFVLSENTLYTTEAWKLFLERLTPEGVVSMSRWYGRPVPAEMYRVAVLATSALRASGIARPREHVVIIATNRGLGGEAGKDPDVATLLMKRTPFTQRDVDTLEDVAKRMGFEIVLTPRAAADAGLDAVTDSAAVDRFVATFSQGDLASPTDDRPFFFMMNTDLLDNLFGLVTLLTLVVIVVPVFLKAERRVVAAHLALSVSFAAIGLGFMLIEIAGMQRLLLLLGHPTFSLSVVLVGLLVSSGLGSFTTGWIASERFLRATRIRLALLVGVLILIGAITPAATRVFQTFSTPVRVTIALMLLMPSGFLMGMVFPIAMKIALARQPSLAPWLWGINGAMSVTASVMAVIISSRWGISVAWWAGVACYVAAGVAIVRSAGSYEVPSAT